MTKQKFIVIRQILDSNSNSQLFTQTMMEETLNDAYNKAMFPGYYMILSEQDFLKICFDGVN